MGKTGQKEAAAQGCRECPYVRMYDYGRRVYYCDHDGREDDMGKIGEGYLPGGCPVWCPLG